jgi:hypothetical protein
LACLLVLFAAALSLLAGEAKAGPVLLDFEGLLNGEPILNFYDGGLGGFGSGPGPDYNIQFGAQSLVSMDSDAGGGGNIGNEPSPDNVAFFLQGPGVIMNVLPGFMHGFSFYYAAAFYGGTVTVWSGPDGTGSLMASMDLDVTGTSCGGDPTGEFNCWRQIGVNFAGIARSVSFSGATDQIAFDNVTMETTPEPGTFALLGAGIGILFWARRRRAA